MAEGKKALFKLLEKQCRDDLYFHAIPETLKKLGKYSLTAEEREKIAELTGKALRRAKFSPLLPVENKRPELSLYLKKVFDI